jgi:protein TonB
LLQPAIVPATPLLERLRSEAGRRTLAFALVLLIEALLLLMLLTLGAEKRAGTEDKPISLVDLKAAEVPAEEPEESTPEAEKRSEALPEPQAPDEPLPRPATDPLPSPPAEAPPALPAEAPPAAVPPPIVRLPSSNASRPAAPPAPSGRVYGPPDRGRPSHLRDTERVGTAPNGQPLYAAAWYREPDDAALGAYLSTAHGPGWGLIACRTVSEYRVEDCVGIAEYPEGSQIMRAVLAAAWEFRVRPPRLGGQLMVGSWVRIRIDYGIKRR